MTPTTTLKNGKLSELVIKVAHGDVLKKEYAEAVGIDPTRVGARLNEDFASVIKELQADKSKLQAVVSDLQAKESQGEADATAVQQLQSYVQELESKLQAKETDLQAKAIELQSVFALLQKAESDNKRWSGKPRLMQFVGNPSSGAFLALLLAAFEVVGVLTLLLPKGLFLAIPAAIAIGFALLHFTAAENKLGRWFSVVFALCIGLFFFKPWQYGELHQDWLFAVVPPVLQAIITTKK